MKVLYLWPLFFLLLIPVIIIMYLLKQKAEEKTFSSLFLWKEMYHNTEANTPWEKLKKNWLMILQIVITVLLIVAVCSPFLLRAGSGADHAVIVIDNSAGMAAAYNEEITRLEKAVDEATDYVRNLRTGTKITVISSAADAVVLYNNGETKNKAIDKIRSIKATNMQGDASAGLEMVRSMQSQWQSVETVCFTDTNIPMKDVEGYIVNVFSNVDNLSVDQVGHGVNGEEMVVLAQITNHGMQEETLDANLYAEDELIKIQSVTIPAGESKVVYFEDLDTQGSLLSVEISVKDALDSDNIAYDLIEEQRETKVLLMSDANLYLEKAIGILPGVHLTKSSDISAFENFTKENFDVYIFDGMIPEKLPEEGNLLFFNIPDTELFESVGDYQGVRLDIMKHTITEYLENVEMGVSKTYSYKVPEWGETFLSCAKEPVAFAGKQNGRNICVFGFDLHNSDLPLKSEFPLLIYSIMKDNMSTGLIGEAKFFPGDTVSIYGKLNEEFPVVKKPDRQEERLKDYHWNYTDTQELGMYCVTQKTSDDLIENRFVVNFPIAESGVAQGGGVISDADEDVVKTSVSGVLDLRNLLIILALVFLGVEWVVYLRK